MWGSLPYSGRWASWLWQRCKGQARRVRRLQHGFARRMRLGCQNMSRTLPPHGFERYLQCFVLTEYVDTQVHPVICSAVPCDNIEGFATVAVAPDGTSITVTLQVRPQATLACFEASPTQPLRPYVESCSWKRPALSNIAAGDCALVFVGDSEVHVGGNLRASTTARGNARGNCAVGRDCDPHCDTVGKHVDWGVPAQGSGHAAATGAYAHRANVHRHRHGPCARGGNSRSA